MNLRTSTRVLVWSCVCCLWGAGTALAQGRGGAIWTTTGGDAQRSSAVRSDAKISLESLSKPGFQLLWKRRLETAGADGVTQPVFSAPGFITHKGFKGVAYMAGTSGTVSAIDYDLNRIFWTRKLTASTCGLPSVTEITQAPPPAAAAGAPPPARGAGGGRGGGRGAVAGLFVVSNGSLHNLNLMDGTDWFAPIAVAPNARVTGSIVVNNVLYVSSIGACSGAQGSSGVYAIDLTPAPAPNAGANGLPVAPVAMPASTTVASWTSSAGVVLGAGPAFGPDGTVYVATSGGSVVALENRTLMQKDSFTTSNPLASSPVVFSYQGRTLVAVGDRMGALYILDAASLGGADHKTPLARVAIGPAIITGLSTYEDANGKRWIVAGTGQNVIAVTLAEQDGKISLPISWISAPIAMATTPTFVNGVVFALASGPRGTLYAIDAATGKGLWNSGTSIASPAYPIAPAVDDSQVYVVATDGTLHAFGFQTER